MNQVTRQAYIDGCRLLARLKDICGEATRDDVSTIVDSALEVYGDEIQVDLLTSSLTGLL